MRMFIINAVVFLTTMGVLSSPGFAGDGHGHEGDIIIGRTADGRLSAEHEWAEVHVLDAVSGLIEGWAGEAPGFDHLEVAEPGEGFFPLESGASMFFEVVSFSPAFKAWDAGAGPYDTAGQQVLLGDALVHTHLDWHIDSADAAFDPVQEVWQASFRLVDLGMTDYGDSDVYTLNFSNVPEPASWAALGLGALGMLRAKRRRAAAS